MRPSILKVPFDPTIFTNDNHSEYSLKPSEQPSQSQPIPRPVSRLLLPASYRLLSSRGIPRIDPIPNTWFDNPPLTNDLLPSKLNHIHKWLWLAGRPMPPRPLNYQAACAREIIISEDINMHLVWTIPRRIFIKPLPRYLLSHSFWRKNIISDLDMYFCALGFLLSYAALIQYESDFFIAREKRLIPEDLTWEMWINLVTQLLEHKTTATISSSNSRSIPLVNMRYQYGELRLSRLNKIYWAKGHPRGYRFPYQSYGEMLTANLAPIAAYILYAGVVLAAMQVGLGTKRLRDSDVFHNLCYGFSLFATLSPILFFWATFVILFVFFVYNWIANSIFERKKRMEDRHDAKHSNTA